jgi:hypothetical protein
MKDDVFSYDAWLEHRVFALAVNQKVDVSHIVKTRLGCHGDYLFSSG